MYTARAKCLSTVCFPKPNHAIINRRRDYLPIWRNGKRTNATYVIPDFDSHYASPYIQDVNQSIPSAGKKQLTIPRDCGAVNPDLTGLELADLLSSSNLREPEDPFLTASGQ